MMILGQGIILSSLHLFTLSNSVENRMHYFMTGATGFIGSHLVPKLIAQGHSVTCLV